MEVSSRGTPPTRPAEVRPVSSTMTIRRSRSGRQVRTITSARRAEARQSMDRTSSPTTYSRRESNSLPCPRSSARCCPSSWRSRASFSGRCRAAGERRQHPHRPGRRSAWPGARPARAARASGPSPPPPAGRRGGPGCSVVVRTACPPGGMATRDLARVARRRSAARRRGRWPRSVRRPGLATVSVDRARSGRAAPWSSPGPGQPAAGRTRAARARSAAIAAASSPFTASTAATSRKASDHQGPGQGRERRAPGQRHRGTGTEPSTASSTPSAVAPSSSASGRSCIRCRSVGRASALTSSGVT